jgi:glycosyltransferase involved in cell wall biosynthesis
MTLCSTIIPTVDRNTLERSVMSALEQELGSALHEILVFNNSKGQLKKAEWMESPQVRIINTHSNLIHASNLGAEMAAGKYINFLHDDDYLLPGALNALVEKAEASGKYWINGCYNLVDDEGNLISTVRPEIKGNIFALLVAGEVLALGASLINKNAFLQVGGFDKEIAGTSDLDVECKLALLSDFESIDQTVATIRLAGGTGATHDWTSRTKQDHRRLREKALSSEGALVRMKDSVRGSVILRGRACRAYLFSAVLNLLDGHVGLSISRLLSFIGLASYYFMQKNFWRGLAFRSHWHNVQKRQQEEFFKAHISSEKT